MAVTIQDLASIRRGRHLGQKEANPSNGNLTTAIKIKSIADGNIAPADQLDRAHLPSQDLPRHGLRAGDVLVALTGANPKIALVDGTHVGSVANQGLAVLTPADVAAGKRLHEYLSSEEGQAALRGLQTGTTIPSISVAKLRTVVVP